MHNIQTVIQASQLFAHFVLDSASTLVLILEGIQHDPFAQQQIPLLYCPQLPTHSRVPTSKAHYTISEARDLLWKGALYVPNHLNLRLTLLQSSHDHHLAGHPGAKKTTQML